MSLAIQRLSRGRLCRSVFVVVARWTRPRAVDSAAVCLSVVVARWTRPRAVDGGKCLAWKLAMAAPPHRHRAGLSPLEYGSVWYQ